MKNKTIKNILWLCLDKIILLLGGLFVSVMVANYLGPNELGKISFGLSLSSLIVTICQWGASNYVFSETAKEENRGRSLIVNFEWLRLVVYLFVWFVLSYYLYTSDKYHDSSILISLVMLSGLFIGLDIYQYYFNSLLESKSNAIAGIWAKLASMLLRVILIFGSFSTIFFIVPICLNNIIQFGYKKYRFDLNNRDRLENISLKTYMYESTPFALSAICIFVYMKINELLLVQLLDYKALGQYAVAYTLSQAWIFFPMAIGISLLSRSIKEKDRIKKNFGFAFVISSMILLSLPVLYIIYNIPDVIIRYTYGVEYMMSADILFALSISSLFSCVVFINNRIIGSMKGGAAYLMKKSITSALIAIPICYFSIAEFGLNGAVYSILLIEVFNLTVLNYFFNKKSMLRIHINCFSFTRYMSELKLVAKGR